MQSFRQWILAIANVILAVAVVIFVFGGGSGKKGAQSAEVDLAPLLKPIESLEEALDRFAVNLQRFNTTIVQYDFLQKDIDRLSGFDQAVSLRLNQERANKEQLGDEAGKEIDELIGQIEELKGQVEKEIEQRRQMLMQLIAGLEQNLAASNLDEEAMRQVIRETPAAPTTPTPATPAPAAPALDMSLPPTIPVGEE